MRTKRRYDQEFKRQAIELAQNSDRSMKDIAEGLGLSPSTLHTWVTRSRKDGRGQIVTDNEITALKKKLMETELERDILKKATAIFSRQQK